MPAADWIVIIAYLVGVVVLGLWLSRGQRTKRDYFLGNRDISWWSVGLSIVATETSALTFIGVPAMAFGGPGPGQRRQAGLVELGAERLPATGRRLGLPAGQPGLAVRRGLQHLDGPDRRDLWRDGQPRRGSNVQRVLACRSARDGQRALVLSAVIIAPQFLIFLLVASLLSLGRPRPTDRSIDRPTPDET